MRLFSVHLNPGFLSPVLVSASEPLNAITAALEARGEKVEKFRKELNYENEDGASETQVKVRTDKYTYTVHAVEITPIQGS